MKRVAHHCFILVLCVAAVAAKRDTDSLHSLQLDTEVVAGQSEIVDTILLHNDELPDWLKRQPNPKKFWNDACVKQLSRSSHECLSSWHGFETCSSFPPQTSNFPNETVFEATRRVGAYNCKVRSNGLLCSYPPIGMLAKAAYESLSETDRMTAVVNVDQSVMTHLVGKDKVWIVEFYADWCPHCRKFAPEFFAMGVALRGAGSLTMLGGVNCEVHADLCQEHGVQAYPTLKIFYKGSDEQVTHILQQHGQYLEQKWQGSFNSVNYHGLLLLLSAGTSGKRGLHEDAMANALNRIDAKDDECQVQREVAVGGGWPAAEAHAVFSSRLADARFMLLYTLRHWVSPAAKLAKPRAFTHDDLKPLALWLNVVARNFPDADLAPKFLRLAALVQESANRPEYAVCIDNWTKHLDDLGLPTTDEITAAVPTQTMCETETCRLWTLIHILTVAPQVQWPGASSDAEAFRGIHAFLENYFRCEVCRKHYLLQVMLASYGKEELDTGSVSLAVYFWRFHNAVSTRIAAEKKCIHPVLDRRWPQSESCQKCWKGGPPQWSVIDEAEIALQKISKAETSSEGSSAIVLSMQLPHEGNVTQHLVGAYWPANDTVIRGVISKMWGSHTHKNSAICIRSGQIAIATWLLTVAAVLV